MNLLHKFELVSIKKYLILEAKLRTITFFALLWQNVSLFVSNYQYMFWPRSNLCVMETPYTTHTNDNTSIIKLHLDRNKYLVIVMSAILLWSCYQRHAFIVNWVMSVGTPISEVAHTQIGQRMMFFILNPWVQLIGCLIMSKYELNSK